MSKSGNGRPLKYDQFIGCWVRSDQKQEIVRIAKDKGLKISKLYRVALDRYIQNYNDHSRQEV